MRHLLTAAGILTLLVAGTHLTVGAIEDGRKPPEPPPPMPTFEHVFVGDYDDLEGTALS